MSAGSHKLINTLIVDDEILARQGVRMVLNQDPDIGEVSEAKNGKEAARCILAHRPDLVFLDVQMPEMDGFDVLRSVGPENIPAVVFVTAFDKYAIEAFEVQAVDYVLKPFTTERLSKALQRAKSLIRSGSARLDAKVLALLQEMAKGPNYLRRLAVKSGGTTIFLEVDAIDWIAAAENYVELHAGKTCHLLQVTMNRLAARLDPGTFLRIHRSSIVNIKSIRSVQPQFHGEYIVTLVTGEQLCSGRTYHEALRHLVSNAF